MKRVDGSSARRTIAYLAVGLAALLAGAGSAFPACGPFTDVSDAAFCPYVLEIFYLDITKGTNPTTYDPTSSVSRLQMAVFLSRTVDRTLKRISRRASLGQYWETGGTLWTSMSLTTIGLTSRLPASDGLDVWVPAWDNDTAGSVTRIRASDGRVLGTWTGMSFPEAALPAAEYVFVTGMTSPGKLYRVFPWVTGSFVSVADNLGGEPRGIALDGTRFWTANNSGSVSIVTPGSLPWTVTTVAAGFTQPMGALYDGANVWITEFTTPGYLRKLDGSGAILKTVTVGMGASFPAFDGTNIWVPSNDGTVAVVRASNGALLATLTGNSLNTGINIPQAAAFDGERILVTDYYGVSLWKASDMAPLGWVSTGSIHPFGVCSDGVNFWVSLTSSRGVARF